MVGSQKDVSKALQCREADLDEDISMSNCTCPPSAGFEECMESCSACVEAYNLFEKARRNLLRQACPANFKAYFDSNRIELSWLDLWSHRGKWDVWTKTKWSLRATFAPCKAMVEGAKYITEFETQALQWKANGCPSISEVPLQDFKPHYLYLLCIQQPLTIPGLS
jgi:hypothetical protein